LNKYEIAKNYGITVESEKSNVIANSICKAGAEIQGKIEGADLAGSPKKAKE
jgi:hypothetical protein